MRNEALETNDEMGVIKGIKVLKTRTYQFDENTPVRAGIDVDGNRFIVAVDVVRALGYSNGITSTMLSSLCIKAQARAIKNLHGASFTKALCITREQLWRLLSQRCFNREFADWLMNFVMGESETKADKEGVLLDDVNSDLPSDTMADVLRIREEREAKREKREASYTAHTPGSHIAESFVARFNDDISVRVVVEPDGQRLLPLIDLGRALGYASSNALLDFLKQEGLPVVPRTVLFSSRKTGTAKTNCVTKEVAEVILKKRCKSIDLYVWIMSEVFGRKGMPERDDDQSDGGIPPSSMRTTDLDSPEVAKKLLGLFENIAASLTEIKMLLN